jgi:hypothetical protein
MRTAGLALERAPPISVPFRFFLTAPVFLFAAAAVLVWSGPEALSWRGSPAALAATHFVTLGFMTMVMAGAMLQMLPVLAGAPVPHVEAVATLVHVGLSLGAAALGGGFLLGQPLLLKIAVWLLGAAVAVLVAAAAIALARAAVRNATTLGMSLAIAALVVAVAFGLVLVVTYAWGVPLANLAVRALHPAWGLLGWAGLLVAAVAFQVVPMFQMTPRYPEAVAHWFTPLAFAALVAWSLAAWYATGSPVELVLGLALAAGFALFASTTLVLQRRRRRRVSDVTTAFWQLGMSCALAACVAWAVRLAAPGELPALEIAIAVLAVGGFAVSVIDGMLYKIVPFLVWFHLQAAIGARRTPHMKKLLGEVPQLVHLGLHTAAVALLVAAVAWPEPLARVAGLALALSAVVLLRNLIVAARRYRSDSTRGPDIAQPTAHLRVAGASRSTR